MAVALTLIGFGEAGMAFAGGLAVPRVRAFDRKTDDADTRDAKLDEYGTQGIIGCDSAAEALRGAEAVLSLVTADQALAAATEGARHIAPGTLWLDLNSVAPDTKRAARDAIAAAGGCYVDVAVMAPVHPARLGAPLLVSGPYAVQGATLLTAIGFTKISVVAGDIGTASSIKMIRSVMVKGIEALSAECVLAAQAAGVTAAVLASLDASPPPPD